MVMEFQMDTHKKIRVHVSALSDGELAPDDLELALAALRAPDGQHAWDTYHRIGDELRAQATPALSDDFSARLAARLDAEPSPARRGGPKDSAPPKRAPARTTTAGKRGRNNQGTRMAAAEGGEEVAAEGKAVVEPKPAIASVS